MRVETKGAGIFENLFSFCKFVHLLGLHQIIHFRTFYYSQEQANAVSQNLYHC